MSLKLYTKDDIIAPQLEELQKEQKKYNRILEALSVLGVFNKNIELELYENIKNDKEEKSLVYCTDLNGDLLMFYSYSTDKNDGLRINKVTYEGETKYDIALAKKFELNEENIELTRIEKINSFKYGRLVTDEKTFYTIFLGDNESYRIEIKEPNTGIKVNEMLEYLNKLDTKPSFKSYVDIFDSLLSEKSIEYKSIIAKAFKDFQNIGTFIIDANQDNSTKSK